VNASLQQWENPDLRSVRIVIEDGNARAFFEKARGGECADSAGAAGDHDSLVFRAAHAIATRYPADASLCLSAITIWLSCRSLRRRGKGNSSRTFPGHEPYCPEGGQAETGALLCCPIPASTTKWGVVLENASIMIVPGTM